MDDKEQSEVRVRRVVSLTPEVFALVEEYYETAQVVVRDSFAATERMLEDGRSGVWVASRGESVVGCVLLKAGIPNGEAGECKRLYVGPAFRRLGLADALMNSMESHARAMGLRWVYLDTNEAFRASVELYRGRGYTECARYNENPQATLFFRKKL